MSCWIGQQKVSLAERERKSGRRILNRRAHTCFLVSYSLRVATVRRNTLKAREPCYYQLRVILRNVALMVYSLCSLLTVARETCCPHNYVYK